MVMPQFGGESGFNNPGLTKASAWNEDYVANLYRNQIKMFATIPSLQGVAPRVLAS